MFIAMNRFKVAKGSEAEFENVWKSRKSRLDELPGYKSFHLLRGPVKEDHTLYSSHTVWETQQHFLDWTRSEQFRDAHKNAGGHKVLYLGHPEFEGFESVHTEAPAAAAV